MYTKRLNRVCTISGMGWINCSNFWRATRIKSRIFNTALSCNNCKTYSHKPSPSENMKTDLKTYSFTTKCLIDTNTPHLSNTLLCYPSPIILIRYVGFAILLWSYIAQHSDTLIDWSSDSSLYPTFPFSCHFYILTPYYSTVSTIEYEILNIQLARTNRQWNGNYGFSKKSNNNFCKKCAQRCFEWNFGAQWKETISAQKF